jgi:GT2 family glycosyltransferase
LEKERNMIEASKPNEPLVDIVMLVHDQASWADLAIRAVEHHTKNRYRLIIVDMASQEQKTKNLLITAQSNGHTVVWLNENRSFSNGVNAGVRAGSAKYIVLLNDDALVTEGWDTAMLQDCSEKGVGLVGARSNYASGAQGDPSFVGEPPFLVFVCVGLRREVWNHVGPMDEETFDGFSSEDLDYSWRVKKADLRLKVSNAYVLHAGSRTIASKHTTPEAQERNNRKYNERLVKKWGEEWCQQKLKLKPKILVCSFHAEEHTRVAFLANLVMLRKTGGLPFDYHQMTRMHIQVARQLVCDLAIDNDYDALFMLDDDGTFPPDTLARLYRHDKECVTALAYQRFPPYQPCIFDTNEEGMGRPVEGVESTGLREIGASGLHCAMIRVPLIKRMREAKISHFFGGFENKFGEDIAFSANVKKVNGKIYCDTDFIAGHIGSPIVVNDAFRKDWIARGRPGLG